MESAEFAQCTSKYKWFRSLEQANHEVKRGKKKLYLCETAYAYKCEFCNGYHVTNGRSKGKKW